MRREPIAIDKKMIERGYWIATHRLVIKKWTMIFLYLVIALFYLIFFVQFGVYLYYSNDWQRYVAEAIQPTYDWRKIHSENAPVDIEFGKAVLYPLSNGRYDFVVAAHNPNEKWAVESIAYQFVSGEVATPYVSTFLLPQEQRYFTVLGFKSVTPLSGTVEFVPSNIRWVRLTRPPALSWDIVEQAQFIPQQILVQGARQTVVPARLTWRVRNNSTLNIRSVLWQYALFSGSTLVSVGERMAEDFTFLEERPFDIALFGSLPRVDSVRLFPIVNIFDPHFRY